MKWTVVYRPAAEKDLAELWLRAADRNAVSAAADAIDRKLKSDPLSAGKSLIGDLRTVIEEPPEAAFQVSVPDRLVSVWAVVMTE